MSVRPQASASTSSNAGTAASAGPQASAHADGSAASLLAEALLSAAAVPRPPRHLHWSEKALDIFFRDFTTEDMDLQLKIAEKVLGDESKAMVFCKMPDSLRQHWVKRLREVHNRNARSDIETRGNEEYLRRET
jgi:hypothetical protein